MFYKLRRNKLAMDLGKLPAHLREHGMCYTYLLIDQSGVVFYVGCGNVGRLSSTTEHNGMYQSVKREKLREIHERGEDITVAIVHASKKREDCLMAEHAWILTCRDTLTNSSGIKTKYPVNMYRYPTISLPEVFKARNIRPRLVS